MGADEGDCGAVSYRLTQAEKKQQNDGNVRTLLFIIRSVLQTIRFRPYRYTERRAFYRKQR